MFGPTLPLSQETHQGKYRDEGENFPDAMQRVASALADNMNHAEEFKEILLDMRFCPGGRIQAAAGSKRITTMLNCFGSGNIEDSMVEGEGSIMNRLVEAVTTMRLGGGIGYDFSTLRPEKALIKKLMSYSSGPLSFMDMYSAACLAISSAGHRRGAQMGVMRVDHPDIFKFVRAKNNQDRLKGFNLSVAVTDEFMRALLEGKPFDLKFNGQVYQTIDPQELWNEIMQMTWDWAEPGVLFIDTINNMNNLSYCEEIRTTNPCAEQPLPPYGACLLGSFNCVKYLVPFTDGYYFDFARLRNDIPIVVRAMDNVNDRSIFPLPQQKADAQAKRRMGLGVMGLANALEAMGCPYGTSKFLYFEKKILEVIRDESYRASVALAREKGEFPLFDVPYMEAPFIKTLPEDIQWAIGKYGIRNSHLTSVAPTGTISLSADNVSSGIEPVVSYEFDRTVRKAEGEVVETVTDYGYRVFGVKGKTINDVSIDDHLDVLITAANLVDSAVSKTCNFSPKQVTYDQFKNVYVRAWEGGAKGCTTFNMEGKKVGILDIKPKEEPSGQACFIDPVTGRKECT